jgi:hypothetical protein
MKPGRLFGRVALGVALLLVLNACDSSTTPPPDPLTITPGPQLALEVGEAVQLTARGGLGQASWRSSDTSVATVVPVTGFLEAVGSGSATITAERGEQEATVTVQVTEPPLLTLAPPALQFEVVEGGDPTPQQSVQVANSGGGTLGTISVAELTYGAGELQGWVSHQVVGQEVRFAADPGSLPEGTYTATAAIAATQALNSPQTVALTLTVVGLPEIALDPTSVAFTVGLGDPPPSPRSVQILNVGSGQLTGLSAQVAYAQGQPGAWLADLVINEAGGHHVLVLTPSTATLPVGSYSAVVTVSSTLSGVEPRQLPVSLTVAEGPAIVLDRTSIALQHTQGQPPPAAQLVQVTNGGGGTLGNLSTTVSYPQGHPPGWLNANLSSTTAPASITLEIDVGALSATSYVAQVQVSSPNADNSPVSFTVSLTVTAAGAVSLNPSLVTLGAALGGANPNAVAIQVTNSGGGSLTGLSAGAPVYVSGGATGWLSTSQPGGTAPTQFLVQATSSGLPVGTYVARVTVTSTSPGSTSATLEVRLDVYPRFSTHVYPNITGGPCLNCHFSGGQNPRLDDGANNVRNRLINGGYVQPGNPVLTSGFLCRITPGRCTGHGNKFSAANAEMARLWVLYGAQP